MCPVKMTGKPLSRQMVILAGYCSLTGCYALRTTGASFQTAIIVPEMSLIFTSSAAPLKYP